MRPHNVSHSDWLQYNLLFGAEHLLGHRFFRSVFGEREERLVASVDRYSTEHAEKSPFEIIEHSGEDQPLFHPYQPEVFRGAALDWACTKKWTFDYFADNFGDKEVAITNNVGLVGTKQRAFETISLRDYIAQLRAGSLKYLKFSQMVEENSTLQEDFNLEWLKKFHHSSEFRRMFFLFMGAKGTVTPIHTALPPTIFVQITGTKKWYFYPTSDRLFLGVRPDRRSYFHSGADPHDESDPKFPLLRHASRRELILNAGDVVWFPPLVWHYVENMTDSIGVAYKFFHLRSSFKASKALTSLFFLATKPPILQSAIVSRLTKKDYTFTRPQHY